jgi:tape measure domain-containing protein
MAVKVEAFRLSGRVEVDNKRAHAAMQESERDAKAVASSFKGLKAEVGSLTGSLSRGGGIIPGLSHISQIIQGIPQIGNLAGALIRPMRDLAEEGLEFNMLIEEAQVGFEGITGGIKQAAKYTKELTDFAAANPIFNTKGTVSAARQMSIFGFETRKTTDYLKVWGGALAAGGQFNDENLQRVVRGFGQIRQLQTVTAEDMNILQDANLPAWEMLAKAIGKSVVETRKLAEARKLNGAAAVDAMTEMLRTDPRFAGAADKFAGTLRGRLAQVQDLREVAAGRAMSGTTKELSAMLQSAMTGDIPSLVNDMAGKFDTALTPVAKVIGASVRGLIGGGITSGLAEGIDAGRALVTKTVGDFALDSVISPFKSMLGINSPSKVFADIGGDSIDGLAFGKDGKGGLASEESKQKLRKALEELATDPRVRAWFEVIRQVEGGRPDVMAGGRTVKSGPRHPGQIVPRSEWYRGQKGPSSAAGNWQITLTNWKKWAPILGLDNWSDPNQQMMVALALFAEGGGDTALLRGDMKGALKASSPWAATPLSHLPGSKPLSADKFVGRYQGLLNGGGPSVMKRSAVPVTIVGVEDGADIVGGDPFIKRDEYSKEMGGVVSVARSAAEWKEIDKQRAQIKGIFDSVKEADGALQKAGEELNRLPPAAANTGLGLLYLASDARTSGEVMEVAAGSFAKSVIGSASKIDSLMGAFGQVTGMLPQQQVGRKRGFFSKLLGFAAPFLSFIPGVGPILSAAAGIGSRALAGDWQGAAEGAITGFSTGGAFRRSGSSTSGASASSSVGVGAGLEPRAAGGPVRKGRTYIVGEHRAEVFEAEEDGFIHPSMDAYRRSRGAGASLGASVRGGSFAAMIQRLIDRIESVPPEHVLTVGSRTRQGQQAIAHGWQAGASRDPKVVEWMNRRAQTA